MVGLADVSVTATKPKKIAPTITAETIAATPIRYLNNAAIAGALHAAMT